MPLYGVDVASYQGRPDWSQVYGAGIRFAFSKVTESTDYVNPTWAYNRDSMLALGGTFLPGCYHFLHGGSGTEQARYFLRHAGDVTKFAVALDVEASGADAATAKAWVSEFKSQTGGHPVIGYFPRWYWEQQGRPDLSCFDSIWQSHYVSGEGTPAALYAKVPATWWAAFGGEPISILQFSSSGSVPGISGRVDCNALRGTLDELRALALGDVMALTADDLKKIRDAVWRSDDQPAPDGNPKGDNPTWHAQNVLGDVNKRVRALQAAVAALAAQTPGDVDEAAIVQGVLAGLAPDQLAGHIAAALGPDVARAVADELRARLEA